MQDVKALYRCEVSNISRQSKHSKCTGSAVAAAAYRAGEALHDDRTDRTHYYNNRAGEVLHAKLIWVHLHKGTKPTTGFKDSEVV